MKINQDILNEVEAYVRHFMSAHLPTHFVYHNVGHTERVVRETQMLSEAMGIGSQKKRLLLAAAWFHDLGYAVSNDNHEEHGARLAGEFLLNADIETAEIERIKSLIRATKYPQRPASKLERILCDADMAHLPDGDFFERSERLRSEWESTRGIIYSHEQWCKLSYDFLSAHSFHTSAGRERFNGGKEDNLRKVKMLLEKNEQQAPKVAKKSKPPKYVKGVETLFRNSSRNHMELSSMADTKAHILMSVSSVIVSIVISLEMQQLTEAAYLILPTILLTTVCLCTIVLAVLTTKPKITKGIFTTDQVNRRDVNLLFFGNFYKMDLATYERGIAEMMHDNDYLYNSMMKDIYFLGKVLAVKYRYLRIGYHIFMYGIIASVLSFGLCFFLN